MSHRHTQTSLARRTPGRIVLPGGANTDSAWGLSMCATRDSRPHAVMDGQCAHWLNGRGSGCRLGDPSHFDRASHMRARNSHAPGVMLSTPSAQSALPLTPVLPLPWSPVPPQARTPRPSCPSVRSLVRSLAAQCVPRRRCSASKANSAGVHGWAHTRRVRLFRPCRHSRGTVPSTSPPPEPSSSYGWRSPRPGPCRSYRPGSTCCSRWRSRGLRRTRRGA